MEESKNSKVVIVLAQCSQSHQFFGIRFEERQSNRLRSFLSAFTIDRTDWFGSWAFRINEQSAKKEGYDRGEIRGTINFELGYPGCPYCSGKSTFKCSCGKVACWDGENNFVKCPWCGVAGELSGQIESLSSGGDR